MLGKASHLESHQRLMVTSLINPLMETHPLIANYAPYIYFHTDLRWTGPARCCRSSCVSISHRIWPRSHSLRRS